MNSNRIEPEDNHTSSSLPKAMETKASAGSPLKRVEPGLDNGVRSGVCHDHEWHTILRQRGRRIGGIVKYDLMDLPPTIPEEIDEIPDEEEEKIFRRERYESKNKMPNRKKRKLAKSLHNRRTPLSDVQVQRMLAELSLDVTPHSGTSFFGLKEKVFNQISEVLGIDITKEKFFSSFENMALLISGLMCATDANQALIFLAMYTKTEYHGSFGLAAYDYISELFSIEPHSTTKPLWLQELRKVMTDWRQIVHCPLRENILKLLSVIVTLGLCTQADVTWSVGNLVIFQPKAQDAQMDAFDLTDAIISTFLFFCETGWECFATGSIAPLFFGEGETLDYAKEYAKLLSCLQHVKTGNLEKYAEMTEQEYEIRIDKCIEKTHALLQATTTKIEAKTVQDRLTALNKARDTFQATRMRGGFRKAPYVTLFWGQTGVGKSSLTAIDMHVTLAAMGVPNSPEHLATLNEYDKYDSSIRGFTTGVFFDESGNMKEQFCDGSPAQVLNRFNNNVKTYAVKADVDEKFKVDIGAYAMNFTSNFPHGGVAGHSHEPASVARRFHAQVEQKVRPEFTKTYTCGIGIAKETHYEPSLCSDKVFQHYVEKLGYSEIPAIPDVWLLTVRKAVVSPGENGQRAKVGTRVVCDELGPMEDVDVFRYLRWKVKEARKYMEQQKSLEQTMNNFDTRMNPCEKCKLPKGVCECVEPHMGFGWAIGKVVIAPAAKRLVEEATRTSEDIELMSARKLLKYGSQIESAGWFALGMFLPENFYRSHAGKYITNYALGRVTNNTMRRLWLSNILLCFSPLMVWPRLARFRYTWYAMGAALVLRNTIAYHYVHHKVTEEFARRRDAMPEVVQNIRDRYLPPALAVGGSLFLAYAAVNIWKGIREGLRDPQGQLCPKSAEEVMERDAEQNPWKGKTYDVPTTTVVQSSSPYEQVIVSATKNLKHVLAPSHSVKGADKRVCMFMIASNVGIIPQHFWEDSETIEATVTGNNGHVIKTVLYRQYSVDVPDSDLSFVYCPALGSQPDFTKFLPDDLAEQGQARGVYREKNGDLTFFDAHTTRERTGHMIKQFDGGTAVLSIPSKNGMCMAPLFVKGKGTQLIGFHLGGKTDKPFGVYGTLTKKQCRDAMVELSKKEGVIAAHSDGIFESKVFGHECLLREEPHDKSPVYYLEPGEANIRVYGECTGRSSFYSGVRTLPMSDHVKEVFGVEQKWGPPRTKPDWKPWYECMKYAAQPTQGMPAKVLQSAIVDYRSALISKFSQDFIRADVKPLTRMQTVCGIDGKRFIDRMNMSTSIGYPLGGPKSKMLIEYNESDYEGFSAPADFPQEIWDEVERVENLYISGSRAKVIFKACLKDEPTLKTKEKVRVFQCAPISFQLLVRKYFLPIARVLSLYPLESECAVGINSVGPEWQQLTDHMEKFGRNRILAGDYSKYDLRMPAQLTIAAFRVLIDFATHSGNYTNQDIQIMKGLALDCAYPVVAFDGTLVEFLGTNPSGQNLTVYINSIVNSLLMRCCFLELYPRRNFRDYVSVVTYGDDVKGSVSMWAWKFNHLTYAEYLSKFGIVFTMPDKESAPIAYMHSDAADFLKRKNVYIPEIGAHVGALDDDSIFKGLHCCLASKHVTIFQQQADALTMAAQEWFFHGRSVYDKRVSQLKQVAQLQGLVVPELDLSFDDRVESYKKKYYRKVDEVSAEQR